jgi:hypothetical protein
MLDSQKCTQNFHSLCLTPLPAFGAGHSYYLGLLTTLAHLSLYSNKISNKDMFSTLNLTTQFAFYRTSPISLLKLLSWLYFIIKKLGRWGKEIAPTVLTKKKPRLPRPRKSPNLGPVLTLGVVTHGKLRTWAIHGPQGHTRGLNSQPVGCR